MKKLFVLFVVVSQYCFGSTTQFLRVNPEWIHQVVHVDLYYPSTSNHEDWIQAHLFNVVAELRYRNFDGTETQKRNRARLLEILHDYAVKKKFPQNHYVIGVRPVFIDAQETHCAVGYLMQQSGHELLAQRINKDHQLDYIRDIRTSGVSEWAEEYGFTIDELAWIQPSYQSSLSAHRFTSGVNGAVHDILEVSKDSLLIGGAFSQINGGSSCNNLAWAIKELNEWKLVPFHTSAANGPVFALHKNQNGIYIGGAFSQVNGVPCNYICRYDYLNTKNIQSMPGLDDTVLTLETYQADLYAGGTFTGLIKKFNNSTWTSISTLAQGNSVRALAVYNGELYYGGDFDIVTGAYRKNILKYSNGQEQVSGMGCLNPVNTFTIHKGELYAGCDFQSADSTSSALVRLDNNGNWHTLIHADSIMLNSYISGKAIYDLVDNGNELYALGDFSHQVGELVGYYNSSTTQLTINGSTVSSQISPHVNGKVYKGIVFDDDIKIGGAFNNITTNAFNIGQFKANPQSIITELPSQLIYPNPTAGKLFFSASLEGKTIQVFSASGQLITSRIIRNGIIDLSSLINGNYLLVADDQFSKQIQIVR